MFLVLGSEQLPEINNDENNDSFFYAGFYFNISHISFISQ